MKIKTTVMLVIVVSLAGISISCGKLGSSKEQMKVDSLFLGISMGMQKQAFFDYCWEMNRQKVFIHGPTNTSVEYKLASEFDHPVIMRFYPTFYNDKINEMPVLFSYESWAPWNKEFGSDILLGQVLTVFKKWYGDDFKVLSHKTMGTVYYQMKGKRRINLFIRDDQYVQAVFTDLQIEQEIKEKGAGSATAQ